MYFRIQREPANSYKRAETANYRCRQVSIHSESVYIIGGNIKLNYGGSNNDSYDG